MLRTKRHAYSLSGTEAPGRCHAARSADRHPYFLHRHSAVVACKPRRSERHRLEASHRAAFLANKLLSQMWTTQETSLRMLIREAALSRPPHWLGRPGQHEASATETVRRCHHHGRSATGAVTIQVRWQLPEEASKGLAHNTPSSPRLHELTMRIPIARHDARGSAWSS